VGLLWSVFIDLLEGGGGGGGGSSLFVVAGSGGAGVGGFPYQRVGAHDRGEPPTPAPSFRCHILSLALLVNP